MGAIHGRRGGFRWIREFPCARLMIENPVNGESRVSAAWLTRRPNEGWRFLRAKPGAGRKTAGLIVVKASAVELARWGSHTGTKHGERDRLRLTRVARMATIAAPGAANGNPSGFFSRMPRSECQLKAAMQTMEAENLGFAWNIHRYRPLH